MYPDRKRESFLLEFVLLIGDLNVTGSQALLRSRFRGISCPNQMAPTWQTSDLHGFFWDPKSPELDSCQLSLMLSASVLVLVIEGRCEFAVENGLHWTVWLNERNFA